MRLVTIITLFALAALPAQAKESLEFQCDAAFAPGTSHERLAEEFGVDNVMFGQIWGDEGTIPEATTIFASVPSKRLSILWHDTPGRKAPAVVYIGEDSLWSVGGLRVGMTIDEVEALNGAPFTLGGFNDMERGAVDSWEKGALSLSSGPCRIDVEFGYGHLGVPLLLDDALDSEGPYSSQDPTYRALGAKINSIVVYYPDAE